MENSNIHCLHEYTMDRIAKFMQENLNGYNLPADDLIEIRGVLLRRFGAKFSEGLSPEGRIAMEEAAKCEVDGAIRLQQTQDKDGSYTTKKDTTAKVTNSTFN
ncbi:uncharacterized protein LOC132718849 [Ruditapes philippinarum]|uniref:uncharacterized protein LOC132718849 n=1 Tax=Ruditapes philippinarum TaxID=129788 RepID=UPI00295BF52C|nr:uncharacterized protein LOC132718849 [Ruditapes philippinarum]